MGCGFSGPLNPLETGYYREQGFGDGCQKDFCVFKFFMLVFELEPAKFLKNDFFDHKIFFSLSFNYKITKIITCKLI